MIEDRVKGYNIERLSFLLVDDNEFMRSVIRAMLKSMGSRYIVEARDGGEALKRLQVFPADIVICDWEMAPMDGIEFTRRIRSDRHSPNRFIPIVMLTGHAELERVKAARDAGVHEFLAKPVQAKAFYGRLCDLIERPRKFVDCDTYFGPDRHRRKNPDYRGPERRERPRGSS